MDNKICFKGVYDRTIGAKIIEALENLGGENRTGSLGIDDARYYYVKHNRVERCRYIPEGYTLVDINNYNQVNEMFNLS